MTALFYHMVGVNPSPGRTEQNSAAEHDALRVYSTAKEITGAQQRTAVLFDWTYDKIRLFPEKNKP